MEAVHVAILVMLVIVVSMSLCMMVQYVDRYHKYQRTAVNDDVTDTECSGNDETVKIHDSNKPRIWAMYTHRRIE